MSTKSFGWTLFLCMVSGGCIGTILGGALGYGLPDAFPAKDPFEHSAANAGYVYGLAFGLFLGVLIGMFYIRWKSWAIKNMIYDWRNGDDPEGNWLEWRPGCIHIVGTVLLVPVALLAIVSIYARSVADRVPLSAYGSQGGLVVRYLGFRPITVVGAYRTKDPCVAFKFKYPMVYRNKGTRKGEDIIPWKQLVPMGEDQEPAKDDESRWELLYLKCEDTANR